MFRYHRLNERQEGPGYKINKTTLLRMQKLQQKQA